MCEKCLYRKNCQFLATHKKAEVAGCTAFVSEDDYRANIKAEAIKEFVKKLDEHMGWWEEPDGYYTRFITLGDFAELVKEMTEETP